ncbi:hypothetical protein RBWH47_04024 [Rhodopirellula baltica WH47]|uniref:Uncharacterized protein n=2 Tax=Rhodopirellula baltica TaxID=265606 RepID=F2AU01_RHOBT|nr:hypothetical protein RBWH47_04024 [Rhodopirellula baltica WH47]
MAGRRIVCPQCKTTLQIPATMGAGKVKCPKCELMLAVRAPVTVHVPEENLFDNLPSLGSSAAAPPSSVFRPSGPVTVYQPPKPAKKRGGGSKAAVKIISTIAGLGLLCILLCAGGIFAVGYLGSRHSGWTSVTYKGYTVSMPAGEDRRDKSQQFPGTTVHELTGRRKETGSQYSLVVADLPAVIDPNIPIAELLRDMRIRLSNPRPVTRSGVKGMAGTMQSGVGAIEGSDCEIYVHNRNLVVMMYSPYSEIKDLVGGRREPRSNESELDKPSEFFDSLEFR